MAAQGTAAERAGLDTTKPINWDDLLGGAERLGSTLQIDDPDGSGLADWVRTLVAAAGDPALPLFFSHALRPARSGRPHPPHQRDRRRGQDGGVTG